MPAKAAQMQPTSNANREDNKNPFNSWEDANKSLM